MRMSESRRMRLYATGFNAWNQLSFKESSQQDEDPKDLDKFELILQAHEIRLLARSLSYTKVSKDGGTLTAGVEIGCRAPPLGQDGDMAATTAAGETLLAKDNHGDLAQTLLVRYNDNGNVLWSQPSEKAVEQIVAYDAGWVILSTDGTVLTMGDPRFEDCLGRDVTTIAPTDCPYEVTDLANLGEPIEQIAAGGYTAVALTESGSLYAWGMESPGAQSRKQAIPGLERMPNYVEVDGEKDIKDIALGESHAIALTTDGKVYAIGGNENGQLGIGVKLHDRASDWTEVSLNLDPRWRVEQIAAAPRASFVIASLGES